MTGDYAASYLPYILIPVITWLLPLVGMGLLFIYIEGDAAQLVAWLIWLVLTNFPTLFSSKGFLARASAGIEACGVLKLLAYCYWLSFNKDIINI